MSLQILTHHDIQSNNNLHRLAKTIENEQYKIRPTVYGYGAIEDGNTSAPLALSYSAAQNMPESVLQQYQSVKREFQNSAGSTVNGGMESLLKTTGAILPDVLRQITLADNMEEYNKIQSIMSELKGQQPMREYLVQFTQAINEDASYDRSIASVGSYDVRSSSTEFNTITSQRRYGMEGVAIDFLSEIRNVEANGYLNIDLFAQKMELAMRHLTNQKIFNFFVGLSGVSSAKGLLTNSIDLTTINTAKGWADFTTEAQARTLVRSVTDNMYNATATTHRPNKLIISYQQFSRLQSENTEVSISSGGTLQQRPKYDVLLDAFKRLADDKFEIIYLNHFNKGQASNPKIFNLANADFSVLMRDHRDNFLDSPMDPMVVVANNGAFDGRGERKTFVYQQFGEFRIARPQLIKAFHNSNFTE